MEWLHILTFSLATLILYLRWRHRRLATSATINLPPGPPGWPIVGNLIQVILQRRPYMHLVHDLHKKYGAIFKLQMGQRTVIYITDPDLIQEALIRRGPLFASRPDQSPTRRVFSLGKCTVNTAQYGPLWRTLRKNFITEIVSPARVKQHEWIRKWAFENHMGRLSKQAQEKGYIEVMSTCRLTITSIMICICFGAKICDKQIREIECILKEITLCCTLPRVQDFLPFLTPFLGSGHLREARKLRKKQMEILGPLVWARKAFVESGGDPTSCQLDMASPVGSAYMDSLLELRPPGWPDGFEEPELVTFCSEVMISGTDTSATMLEWALFHLVLDQGIQETLYEEITERIKKEGDITEENVEKLTYLNGVITETMRRHPPSHFLLSHATTEDTTLAGYTIPSNSILEIYTASMTQDPKLWPDPNQFRPIRFLPNGEGFGVDLTGNKSGLKMLPFGTGRRICPAWSLGILQVSLLLVKMIHAFKWIPFPGCPPDPTETFALAVIMKYPLKVIALPR